MSKLRDLVRQAARPHPQAIGFARTRQGPATPAIVVVALVADAEAARAAVEAEAGALLYTGLPADAAGVVEAAGSRPVGCRLDAATGAEAAALAEAGVDFLVFDDGRAEAAALRPPELGRVLLLAGDEDEERLRTLAALEPEAALVAPPTDATAVGRASARALAALRRRAELLRAPLAIEAGALDADTLEAWRDAAAPIVVVAGERVAEAVAAASDVPLPHEGERPRERSAALPPAVAARAEERHEHDHDDEDRLPRR